MQKQTFILLDGTSQDKENYTPSVIGEIANSLEQINTIPSSDIFYSKGIARFENNPFGRIFGANIEELIQTPAEQFLQKQIQIFQKQQEKDKDLEHKITLLGYSRGADICKRIIHKYESLGIEFEHFFAIDCVDITKHLTITNMLGLDLNREFNINTQMTHFKAGSEKRKVYKHSNITGDNIKEIIVQGSHQEIGGGVYHTDLEVEPNLQQKIIYQHIIGKLDL